MRLPLHPRRLTSACAPSARAKTRASLIGTSILLCLAFHGCIVPPETRQPSPRVLIVGIDGASSRVIDTMFANGRLKNLRAIAERGVYGPLKSEVPPLSPRVWTTVATGKAPKQHGILGWVKATEGKDAELFYSSDRTGHALWNIVSDAGKKVAVINWLITYPPEKINGVVISDHALGAQLRAKEKLAKDLAEAWGRTLDRVKGAHNFASAIYPTEWEERALAPEHARAVLTNVASPFAESAADDGFKTSHPELQEYWSIDQRITSIALDVVEETEPDVTMLLLQGIDRVSHSLFGCLDTPLVYPPTFRLTPEQRIHCQSALYDVYEFTDQLLGKVIAKFDDDDLILVVSDHGFETRFKGPLTGGHDSEWAAYGVCLARGPRVSVHGRVYGMNVADVTPTVLAWLGLPLAKDMDGKPAPFLEPSSAAAPEPIATYDTKAVERMNEGESGGESGIKEQLRSLGYLD